ncbi:RHS repeat-associated core domain-containing protein [Pseudomonas sp. MAG733B]|uniref:RHS repeat-associated core domain-containing protein n=1 Tax=Pseudomonas sp. MAG733B TaxID=3122079 RepID=UPI0030CF6FD7
MTGQLGYNGERREEATGCYVLGNGYRVFSPGLMRFFSPDSESPFAKGGLNPYAYCEWSPANYVDPTGKWRFFPMTWLTRMIGGLFGKTASASTKGASTGAKSAKAASSNMTAAKGTSATAKTVKSVAKETFDGGKISRKGAVSNGRVKGGFWDSLENGEIELNLNRGSTNVPELADVTGPKMIDGLGNPSTGYQQLMTKVKSPDSMFQSMVNGVNKNWSQAAEAMESVRK